MSTFALGALLFGIAGPPVARRSRDLQGGRKEASRVCVSEDLNGSGGSSLGRSAGEPGLLKYHRDLLQSQPGWILDESEI